MSDSEPSEVCLICAFPSDELNGEDECPDCEAELEADQMEHA